MRFRIANASFRSSDMDFGPRSASLHTSEVKDDQKSAKRRIIYMKRRTFLVIYFRRNALQESTLALKNLFYSRAHGALPYRGDR
jgi:hypothetical protein